MNVIRQVPNKSGDSAFQLSLLLNGEGVIYGKFISFIRKWSFVWAVGLVKVRVTKLLFNMGCYKPRVPAWLVHIGLSLSLPSGAQGVMGRREARERDFLPFPFPSLPAPAARVTRRRLWTGQGPSGTTKARHLHLKILILDFLLAYSQNCQTTCRPVKCDKNWCSKTDCFKSAINSRKRIISWFTTRLPTPPRKIPRNLTCRNSWSSKCHFIDLILLDTTTYLWYILSWQITNSFLTVRVGCQFWFADTLWLLHAVTSNGYIRKNRSSLSRVSGKKEIQKHYEISLSITNRRI